MNRLSVEVLLIVSAIGIQVQVEVGRTKEDQVSVFV